MSIGGDEKPKVSSASKVCESNQSGTKQAKLSPREKEVLEWLAAGIRPEQIAERMGVGYRTIDKHINSSKNKLGARTRDQAVAIAVSRKLILLQGD